MQTAGHLNIYGEITLVLYRNSGYERRLKRRSSGQRGTYLEDESAHFAMHPELLERLKRGETIKI